MFIPLIYEHLINKYFVRGSVGQATKVRNEKYRNAFFSTPIQIFCSSYIILIISNSFATYGCCHPCFVFKSENKFERKHQKKVTCPKSSDKKRASFSAIHIIVSSAFLSNTCTCFAPLNASCRASESSLIKLEKYLLAWEHIVWRGNK